MKPLLAVLLLMGMGCAHRQCTETGGMPFAEKTRAPWMSTSYEVNVGITSEVIVGGVKYVEPKLLLCDDGAVQWTALPAATEK